MLILIKLRENLILKFSIDYLNILSTDVNAKTEDY